jgi:hypothetical protein
MSVDLDAAETLQTGTNPASSATAGADSDLVDGAGRPLPPGAKISPLGIVIGADNKPLKGYKARLDLKTAPSRGPSKPKTQTVIADAPAEKPRPAADEANPLHTCSSKWAGCITLKSSIG